MKIGTTNAIHVSTIEKIRHNVPVKKEALKVILKLADVYPDYHIFIECAFRCTTCSTQETCVTCRGDRENTPTCSCRSHTYDNEIDEKCQDCDYKCGNCDKDGCLDCAGNMVLQDDRTCSFPLISIEHQGERLIWASSNLYNKYQSLLGCCSSFKF